MTTRVMVVEDEMLFRDMLKMSLASQTHLEVVGAAGDGESAVRIARESRPDVILMDIELAGGANGIETGLRIKEESPQIGIVLLSLHNEKEYLSAIPLERASGWSYLMKRSVADFATLTRVVEGAAAGLTVLDPAIVQSLRPKKGTPIDLLTTRHRQVLQLMAQGYSNAAVAQMLFISEKSVENYINAIYQNLQLGRDEPIHPRVKAVLMFLTHSHQE